MEIVKFYLEIEIRYDVHLTIDDEVTSDCNKKIFHSNLFESLSDCIFYGNKLIEKNLWLEQYPGSVGNRLDNKFGLGIVRFSLKNGAEIFITVQKLKILDCIDDLVTELSKFNISKINKFIK